MFVDAVLTDIGRSYLARNDGSFSMVKFALGDDEVDYANIKKYGRTVGKERIEKLTPVLEALTNQSYAQKYKLISVSNPNLVRLPRLSLSGDFKRYLGLRGPRVPGTEPISAMSRALLAGYTKSRVGKLENILHLDFATVRPEYEGKGLARKLFDAAVAWARETDTKVLSTCSV